MKKLAIAIAVAALVGGGAYYAQSYANDQADKAVRDFVAEKGLTRIVDYGDVKYGLLGGITTIQNVEFILPDGEIKINSVRVGLDRESRDFPKYFEIYIDGLEDIPFEYLQSINGFSSEASFVNNKAMLYSIQYGLERATDFSLSYKYSEDDGSFSLAMLTNRQGQYEAGFEYELINIERKDIRNFSSILNEAGSIIDVLLSDDVSGRGKERQLQQAMEASTNRLMRDFSGWDFTDRVAISRASISWKDAGLFEYLEAEGAVNQAMIFPDEDVDVVEREPLLIEAWRNIEDDLNVRRITEDQQDFLQDVDEEVKEFLQGGGSLQIVFKPKEPQTHVDLQSGADSMIGFLEENNIKISAN